jgi:hypothetical protein
MAAFHTNQQPFWNSNVLQLWHRSLQLPNQLPILRSQLMLQQHIRRQEVRIISFNCVTCLVGNLQHMHLLLQLGLQPLHQLSTIMRTVGFEAYNHISRKRYIWVDMTCLVTRMMYFRFTNSRPCYLENQRSSSCTVYPATLITCFTYQGGGASVPGLLHQCCCLTYRAVHRHPMKSPARGLLTEMGHFIILTHPMTQTVLLIDCGVATFRFIASPHRHLPLLKLT